VVSPDALLVPMAATQLPSTTELLTINVATVT